MEEQDRQTRPEIPDEGLNGVISRLKQDNFNGAIACLKGGPFGPEVIADGFGSDGEDMMETLGNFLSGRSMDPEERMMMRKRRRRRKRRKEFDVKGLQEEFLEKLEKVSPEIYGKDADCAVIWAEKIGSKTRFGFEGLHDSLDKMFYSLDAGLRMRADWNTERGPVKSQGPQHQGGKVLDFGEVVGMEDVKEAFKEMVIRPILYPELHEKYQVGSGGGVLLYGPPGCGKTYIARAAAGELDAEFYHVQLSDLLNKWFGETEERIKRLFKQVKRKEDLAILFFDEIDSLAPERDRATRPMREALGQLLSELDGFDQVENVMILGATNHPWMIDTAVTRPGRIDQTIFVPPPNQETRRELFKYYTRERPAQDLDHDSLAERSDGFSCADVRHVCEQAIKKSLKMACELVESGQEANLPEATMNEFQWAIERQSPSIDRWVNNVRRQVKSGGLKGSFPELEEWVKEQSPQEEELGHYG